MVIKTKELGMEIEGKPIYLTPNGLKISSKGKILEPGKFLGRLDKGTARKLRKKLRAIGVLAWARAQRIPD